MGGSAGCNIVLQHENGYYTAYAHLRGKCKNDRGCKSCDLIAVGTSVKRGQQIAKMGHTGVATGTHLHFGLAEGWNATSFNSYSFNPRNLFQFPSLIDYGGGYFSR